MAAMETSGGSAADQWTAMYNSRMAPEMQCRANILRRYSQHAQASTALPRLAAAHVLMMPMHRLMGMDCVTRQAPVLCPCMQLMPRGWSCGLMIQLKKSLTQIQKDKEPNIGSRAGANLLCN